MTTHRTTRNPRSRRGFSLIEISIATTLVVMLAMLLSAAWTMLGKPMIQTVALCTIAQEADVALAYLSSDLGGCPPNGPAGDKTAGQLVAWSVPSDNEFVLCFDSPTDPNGLADWAAPDHIIGYQILNNALVRYDDATGESTVIAKDVLSMYVELVDDALTLSLTFNRRDVTQTYNLIAGKP
jgi:prepilin-type N-terminal cleavage/methylation domain-containing protein